MSSEKDSKDTPAEDQAAAGGRDSPSNPDLGNEASGMDKLKDFFLRALHLGGEQEEDVPHVLEEPTLEGIARYIKSGKCKNIITMVGAGISTSAGIPDFRSPGSGLYDNLQAYNLPHPTAIFEIGFFKENPKPFFVLAKELYPGLFKPTPCHYFIRMLREKGLLLRHYTQNIDTLERVSGVPDDKLVEAHGTFHTSHCLECGSAYSLPWMKEKIFADEIPKCTEKGCTGLIKPDIVFFGESLPSRFAVCAQQDFKKCDLLIIMGTSLAVQPFASLAGRVSASTPRLYINLDKGNAMMEDSFLALLMGGASSGFMFDSEDNFRDVFKQSTCDGGCYELADLLGWGDELRNLVKSEHQRIDQEKATGDAATSSSNPNRKVKAEGATSDPATESGKAAEKYESKTPK